MKISYTTLSVQKLSIQSAILIAKRKKLDGIELRGKENEHISVENSFEYCYRVKQLLEQEHLQVPCLTAYTKFYQSSEKAVNREIEKLLPILDLAEYIKAHTVRVFMGSPPESLSPQDALMIAQQGLMNLSEVLNGREISVSIETHDSAKTGQEMAKILQPIPEQIGVLLDIIHPFSMGESIDQTWEYIGSRINHVHIKDASTIGVEGNVYCAIGKGLIPVEHIVSYMLSKGYDGYFSLEWEKSVSNMNGISFEDQLDSFVSFMSPLRRSTNNEN
ncbi:MAG: sugar phosphate isomerase/epimerase family protein [Peptococcales bacterium]|jgi:sugar phosphate isomerase/epimerase